MPVLYANSCFNEVCYRVTTLYIAFFQPNIRIIFGMMRQWVGIFHLDHHMLMVRSDMLGICEAEGDILFLVQIQLALPWYLLCAR